MLAVAIAHGIASKEGQARLPKVFVNKSCGELSLLVQCTGMRFASFLSSGFITVIVVNPTERKLAIHTSVQWFKLVAINVMKIIDSEKELKSKRCH